MQIRMLIKVLITVFIVKVNLICGMLRLMLRNEFSDFMEFCIISRLARLHNIQSSVRNKPENSTCPTGNLKTKDNLTPMILTCPALCHMIHLTYLGILIGSRYEDAMASSEDPDQTTPRGAV